MEKYSILGIFKSKETEYLAGKIQVHIHINLICRMFTGVFHLLLLFVALIFLGYGLFMLSENWKLKYSSLTKKAVAYIGIFLGVGVLYTIIPYVYSKSSSFSSRPLEGSYLSAEGDTIIIDNENIQRKKTTKEEFGKYIIEPITSETYYDQLTHFYFNPQMRGFDAKIAITHSNYRIVRDPIDKMYGVKEDTNEKTEYLWYKSNKEGLYLAKYKYLTFLNPVVFFRRIK